MCSSDLMLYINSSICDWSHNKFSLRISNETFQWFLLVFVVGIITLKVLSQQFNNSKMLSQLQLFSQE